MQATRFRLAAFAFCALALLAVAACQDAAVTPVESVARPTPTPAQPSPTVAPAATPTPTASATLTPAPTSTPSPTPAPSATPSPAPTATATATPTLVPTPTPTATLIPTPTPAPALAPTAAPASAPTPAPTAAPSAQQRSSADSSESAPTPEPTRAPAALTPTPTPPVAIPFDQLLPPPYIPDSTPTGSPTLTPTPPVAIPFDQLLPPPYVPDSTPIGSPTPHIPFTQLLPPGPPPTSAATPTPTPTRATTPSFQESLALARSAVVELTASGNTWTGVAFNAEGEIITSAQDLSNAPLAEFRFANGVSGQAWVAGRDDANSGLALLRPVGPARTYPFLPLASSQPAINTAMGLVQYTGAPNGAPTARNTRIIGFRPGFSGYNYLQVQAANNTTRNGALIVNALGQAQGIRLPLEYLTRNGIATSNEVYAVVSREVESIAVPLLRGGQSSCAPKSGGVGDMSSLPALPVIFYGNLSIDGQAAPRGTLLYARLIKQGKPDVWDCIPTRSAGEYVFPVVVSEDGYDDARVELWTGGRTASATSVYDTSRPGSAVKLSLAF